ATGSSSLLCRFCACFALTGNGSHPANVPVRTTRAEGRNWKEGRASPAPSRGHTQLGIRLAMESRLPRGGFKPVLRSELPRDEGRKACPRAEGQIHLCHLSGEDRVPRVRGPHP